MRAGADSGDRGIASVVPAGTLERADPGVATAPDPPLLTSKAPRFETTDSVGQFGTETKTELAVRNPTAASGRSLSLFRQVHSINYRNDPHDNERFVITNCAELTLPKLC